MDSLDANPAFFCHGPIASCMLEALLQYSKCTGIEVLRDKLREATYPASQPPPSELASSLKVIHSKRNVNNPFNIRLNLDENYGEVRQFC